MQSNIYVVLEEISQIINSEKVKKLNNYLSYNNGSYISTNELANKLNIRYDDAKTIIRILLRNDIVEVNYKVYCDDSIDMSSEVIYDNIEDVPNEVCDNCEKRCSILKNLIIIYKIEYEDEDKNE
ncbi:hypothetical protein [Clostridium sp. HBUAS56017]|uniref:hypothetical protein n=1 Tax=Clostridium sp. HBUAS56017 TaxID=2571128 RepID=UPI0011775B7E|nr:hypothetical protein [Clostridium sp. HBUAS56017]